MFSLIETANKLVSGRRRARFRISNLYVLEGLKHFKVREGARRISTTLWVARQANLKKDPVLATSSTRSVD